MQECCLATWCVCCTSDGGCCMYHFARHSPGGTRVLHGKVISFCIAILIFVSMYHIVHKISQSMDISMYRFTANKCSVFSSEPSLQQGWIDTDSKLERLHVLFGTVKWPVQVLPDKPSGLVTGRWHWPWITVMVMIVSWLDCSPLTTEIAGLCTLWLAIRWLCRFSWRSSQWSCCIYSGKPHLGHSTHIISILCGEPSRLQMCPWNFGCISPHFFFRGQGFPDLLPLHSMWRA